MRPSRNRKNLVNLKTFYSRHEAEQAKGLLDEKGIEAFISVNDVGASRPSLAFVQGVKLLVKKEDIHKARDIIKVLEEPQER